MDITDLDLNIPNDKLTPFSTIAIIMKKMNINHVLKRTIIKQNESTILSFEDASKKNQEELIQRYNKRHKIQNTAITYSFSKTIYHKIAFEYDMIISFDEVKHTNIFDPYLSFLHSPYKKDTLYEFINKPLRCNAFIRSKIDADTLDITNANGILNKIDFIDKFNDKFIPFLILMQYYTLSKNRSELSEFSISKYSGFKSCIDYILPIKTPKTETINTILDALNFVSKYNTDNLNILGIRINFNKQYENTKKFNLYLKNLLMFSENGINRFKDGNVFHPGLHFIAAYLERTNNIENFKILTRKNILNSL